MTDDTTPPAWAVAMENRLGERIEAMEERADARHAAVLAHVDDRTAGIMGRIDRLQEDMERRRTAGEVPRARPR